MTLIIESTKSIKWSMKVPSSAATIQCTGSANTPIKVVEQYFSFLTFTRWFKELLNEETVVLYFPPWYIHLRTWNRYYKGYTFTSCTPMSTSTYSLRSKMEIKFWTKILYFCVLMMYNSSLSEIWLLKTEQECVKCIWKDNTCVSLTHHKWRLASVSIRMVQFLSGHWCTEQNGVFSSLTVTRVKNQNFKNISQLT